MWSLVTGDILAVKADALVCSANPFLTLSGGVGGAFLLRYGPQMQERLQAYLDTRGVRHVPPGTVVAMPPCGAPYKAVLHAVAVDGAYGSSSQRITQVVEQILTLAESTGAGSVVLPALATGYGKLTKKEFAEGLRPLVTQGRTTRNMIVCLKREEDAVLIRALLGLDAP